MAFGDVAFQICENGVFKEKNVRLNSAGCEPHSRSDECFLFENPIFTLLKRHVRKRHVYRLPKNRGDRCSMISSNQQFEAMKVYTDGLLPVCVCV